MTIEEQLTKLDRLKTEWQASEKAAKDAKSAYKSYEYDLYAILRAAKIQSVRHDGNQFIRRSTTYGQVSDRVAFDQWLYETDQVDEFLEPEPRKLRLNELARHLIETKADPADWPPGFTSYNQDYIARQKG